MPPAKRIAKSLRKNESSDEEDAFNGSDDNETSDSSSESEDDSRKKKKKSKKSKKSSKAGPASKKHKKSAKSSSEDDYDNNDNEDPFVSGHDYKCETCNMHFKGWPKLKSHLNKKHSKKELVQEIYFKELKTVAFIKEKFEKGAGKVYGQGQYSLPEHKGRGKCRKCVACLRPKCGKCDYCLKPYKHKGCQEKVCLYPDPVTRPKSPELE